MFLHSYVFIYLNNSLTSCYNPVMAAAAAVSGLESVWTSPPACSNLNCGSRDSTHLQ